MTRLPRLSVIAPVLLLGTLSGALVSAQGQRMSESVTADQAIECIRAAVASLPGRVGDLDIDIKRGKVICEVEIYGEDGSKSEVHVDAESKEVIGTHRD